ncbi:helix-turn-helix domain-containing protein [Enterococcus crotali]|uniref:helix-turn-helix domain-containing protein n=1 Tax=Enterococcus crotali TaxID=1453587 RepID=UPI0004707CD7
MNIGEQLKSRRKELEMTQEEVAKQLFISRQAISNWETGKSYPDIENIIILSDIYEISLDNLLKGDKKVMIELKKKTVYQYVNLTLAILSVISIGVCLLVDLLITGHLSWSLIVTSSLIYAIAIGITLYKSMGGKLIKAFFTASLLLIPLLASIQYSLYLSQINQTKWLMNLGIPLALLWLIIIWLVIAVTYIFKLNLFLFFSLLGFASMFGSYLTGLFTGLYTNINDYFDYFLSNGLASLIVGLICLVMGVNYSKRAS